MKVAEFHVGAAYYVGSADQFVLDLRCTVTNAFLDGEDGFSGVPQDIARFFAGLMQRQNNGFPGRLDVIVVSDDDFDGGTDCARLDVECIQDRAAEIDRIGVIGRRVIINAQRIGQGQW